MAMARKRRMTMSQGREEEVMKDPLSDLLWKRFTNEISGFKLANFYFRL